MSAYQRTKGANAERELVNLLKEKLPEYEWQRLAPLQTSNKKIPDVGADGFPFHIEVKKGKATIQSALKQAKENAALATSDAALLIPIAITRKDHEKWIVSMDLNDWIDLFILSTERRNKAAKK